MVRPAIFFIFMCGALTGYLAQQDWQPLFLETAQQAAAVQLSSEVTHNGPYSIETALDSLTLEEKVGQLLMIGHWKQDYYQHTKNMLTLYGFGGVIIMEVDEENIDTIPDWISAWEETSKTPLLISIDQEGGVVNRLQTDAFIQTSQRDIRSIAEAKAIGEVRGNELKLLGINTNLAPVIDYSSSSDSFLFDRSFASSSQITGFADALVQGHSDSGILAIPKHFPGHADTPDDSHFVLPVVDITAAEFPEHVAQFNDLLKTTNVDALMTAHVQFPKLDDQYPATLSYEILSRQLRRDLGFNGVIITDDMTMGAITNQWTTNEATIQAINAGADIVLFAADPNAAMEAHTHLVQAVKNGTISEERIDESVTRILKLKQKYN